MRLSRLLCALAIVASALALRPASAHADTYQVVNLFSDNGFFFSGIDNAGLVVISQPASSACGGATCYFSFLNGVSTGAASTAAPAFTADNGASCAPGTPAGFIFSHGVCNNGRSAYAGFSSSAISHPSLYDDLGILLGDGSGSFLFMNSIGDIVWNDPVRENWVEAIDLTSRATPEPSSLILLATGSLGIAAFAVRRRVID